MLNFRKILPTFWMNDPLLSNKVSSKNSYLILQPDLKEIHIISNSHGTKNEVFHLGFIQYIWPNTQETAYFDTFTKEILNGKVHFLCCGRTTVKILWKFRDNLFNICFTYLTLQSLVFTRRSYMLKQTCSWKRLCHSLWLGVSENIFSYLTPLVAASARNIK